MSDRAGGERRGSSEDRRRRKEWMLRTWTHCAHDCGTKLTEDNVEADRIIQGGSYRRDNIVAACRPCNRSRSNNPNWAGPEARSAACLALA